MYTVQIDNKIVAFTCIAALYLCMLYRCFQIVPDDFIKGLAGMFIIFSSIITLFSTSYIIYEKLPEMIGRI